MAGAEGRTVGFSCMPVISSRSTAGAHSTGVGTHTIQDGSDGIPDLGFGPGWGGGSRGRVPYARAGNLCVYFLPGSKHGDIWTVQDVACDECDQEVFELSGSPYLHFMFLHGAAMQVRYSSWSIIEHRCQVPMDCT